MTNVGLVLAASGLEEPGSPNRGLLVLRQGVIGSRWSNLVQMAVVASSGTARASNESRRVPILGWLPA